MKKYKEFNESKTELKTFLTYSKKESKKKVKITLIEDDSVEFVDISGDISGKRTKMSKEKFLKNFYR